MPWRNFLSQDFRTKFHREVPLFLEIPNFLLTQCWTGGRKLACQNQLDSFSCFDRTPTCDRRTDTDTDGHRSMASTADA